MNTLFLSVDVITVILSLFQSKVFLFFFPIAMTHSALSGPQLGTMRLQASIIVSHNFTSISG